MKLFAQHGYGPGEKMLNGIQEGSVDGVILSARYEKQEKLEDDIENLKNASGDVEILLDPEVYACFYANMPVTTAKQPVIVLFCLNILIQLFLQRLCNNKHPVLIPFSASYPSITLI